VLLPSKALHCCEKWETLVGVRFQERGVLASGDEGFVAVVEGEVHGGFFLQDGVVPAVVDA
jgi:hypothetical protein